MYQRSVLPLLAAPGLPQLGQVGQGGGLNLPPLQPAQIPEQKSLLESLPLMSLLGGADLFKKKAEPDAGKGPFSIPPDFQLPSGAIGLAPGFLTNGLSGAGGAGETGINAGFLTRLLGL